MNNQPTSFFLCPSCNEPYATYHGMCVHYARYCKKKNMFAHQAVNRSATILPPSQCMTTDPVFADADDPFIPIDPSRRIHEHEQSLTTTEKLIADDRIQPEEEALGYSNTVLLHVGSLTERSRQILQRDKVARKELVVEEELEVDEEAAETMNDISEDAMSAWNNIDDDSQDDDSDYEWDNNEEEVDDQDDHDDIEPHTISWDSYKNVDNIDGLDFIPPKPYVKGSMSPLEIAYVDLMYRLNHHNVDLNMFDEIVEWLCGFSDKHSGIFDKIPKKMRMKRGTFINQVRKKFGGTRSAMSVVKEVSLPSGRVASLPTFDFRKLATEMLVDKTLMTDDNMKQTNLDLNTLLPIVPIYHRSTDPRREKNMVATSSGERGISA